MFHNPSQKSVVLESSVKPVRQPRFGLTEDSRTTDSGSELVQSARGQLNFDYHYLNSS